MKEEEEREPLPAPSYTSRLVCNPSMTVEEVMVKVDEALDELLQERVLAAQKPCRWSRLSQLVCGEGDDDSHSLEAIESAVLEAEIEAIQQDAQQVTDEYEKVLNTLSARGLRRSEELRRRGVDSWFRLLVSFSLSDTEKKDLYDLRRFMRL
jgi:hypothetical protein